MHHKKSDNFKGIPTVDIILRHSDLNKYKIRTLTSMKDEIIKIFKPHIFSVDSKYRLLLSGKKTESNISNKFIEKF